MQKKKMWVEWEDGADLSQSQKKPGKNSPLTRDGDNNLGHVVLSDVDENEEQDWQVGPDPDEPAPYPTEEELLGALVLLGVVVAAAERAAPHVKRWWSNQAVPFLKKSKRRPFLKKSTRRFSRDRRAIANVSVAERLGEYITVPESTPTESSQDVIAALDAYRARMSSTEARERFVAALVARLFSEEQLRLLRNARIEDDGTALELASALETLTPQQLGESITRMLEANPSWPGEETLAELERMLERNSREDGQHVPVSGGRITRALRLPRSEE